ncbi:hypothetical protein VXE41_12720 [Acinetobacter variabilis]
MASFLPAPVLLVQPYPPPLSFNLDLALLQLGYQPDMLSPIPIICLLNPILNSIFPI